MDSRKLKSKILIALLVAVSLSTSISPVWAQSDAKREMKLGETLYFNGNTIGAIRAFKTAIDYEPSLERAHLDLLRLYMNSGDHTSAIVEASEVLKREPTNKGIWLVLASVLQNSPARANVLDTVQDAVATGADFPTAHFCLGMLLLDKKNYQAAIDSFELALKEQPNFPGAHLNMAIALGNMGKTQEALNEVAVAIQENNKYTQAYAVKKQLLALADVTASNLRIAAAN